MDDCLAYLLFNTMNSYSTSMVSNEQSDLAMSADMKDTPFLQRIALNTLTYVHDPVCRIDKY